MSDLLVGTIVGGLIGVVPSLVVVFVERSNLRSQQRHDINLKKIEIYEAAKRDALQSFMYYLGPMAALFPTTGISHVEYYASAQKACMYVSKSTASLISEVTQRVLEGKYVKEESKSRDAYAESLLEYLNNAIRDELLSHPNDLNDERGGGNHKRCANQRNGAKQNG